MEIEDIRQELNHLLNSVVEHSTKYSDERPIPSLEISFVLTKINKMKENLVVLKYLLEEKEKAAKRFTKSERQASVTKDVVEAKEERTTSQETIEPKKEENITLNDNLEQSPISTLTDAFTLNDRYLFANELFNKDMNAFNEFVTSIDSCASLDEAKEIISTQNWDDENEQIQAFNTLVERRFL